MAAYKQNTEELFGAGGPKSSGKPKVTVPQVVASKAKVDSAPKPPTEAELRQKTEAEELMREGETFLTKPRFALFWSAEYSRAASCFEKAANKLHAARFSAEAQAAFVRAAENQAKEG